jgi:hypothetical protein
MESLVFFSKIRKIFTDLHFYELNENATDKICLVTGSEENKLREF